MWDQKLKGLTQLDKELLRVCFEGYLNEANEKGRWRAWDACSYISKTRFKESYDLLDKNKQTAVRKISLKAKHLGILNKAQVGGHHEIWRGSNFESFEEWLADNPEWGSFEGHLPMSAFTDMPSVRKLIEEHRLVFVRPNWEKTERVVRVLTQLFKLDEVEVVIRHKDEKYRGTKKPIVWKGEGE